MVWWKQQHLCFSFKVLQQFYSGLTGSEERYGARAVRNHVGGVADGLVRAGHWEVHQGQDQGNQEGGKEQRIVVC